MKKNITIMILSFLAFSLYAQEDNKEDKTSGTVIYEETLKLDIQINGISDDMANSLPKESKNKKILYFNEDMALYDDYKEENSSMDEAMDQSDAGMSFAIYQPENKIYTDLDKNMDVMYREFMTRYFIIERERKNYDIKLTGNQKEILGYPCLEAIVDTDRGKQSVWFTSEIPISIGPNGLNGLPGLILEIGSEPDQIHLLATSVEFNEPDKELFKIPKKGKKLTEEEFEAMVMDRTEGNGEGGEQQVVITISK